MSFSVKLRSDLPGGTPIFNQAVVYFPSASEETPTNAWVNVVQPVVAVPQSVQTNYMQPVSITLEGRDVGDRPVTFTLVSSPDYGYLSLIGAHAVYTPAKNFVGMDRFTYRVSNGVMDSSPADVVIQVLPAGDTTAPRVIWTDPAANASEVKLMQCPLFTDTVGPAYQPFLRLQFSEPMNEATVTASHLSLASIHGTVPVSVTYAGNVRQATIIPRQMLAYATRYTVTVAIGVQDVAGNPLEAAYQWSFTTVGPPLRRLYLPLVMRKW